MNDRNDQRALIAITLCLAVFTIWSYFFGPKPKPAETVPETPVAEAAPNPEAPATATATIASGETPLPTVTEGPCVPAPASLNTLIADLSVDNCGDGIGGIHLTGTPAPLTVTPWWTWIWKKVTGTATPGWDPYVQNDGLEGLVQPGSAFAVAGRGAFRTSGTWESTPSADAVTLRRTSADGLTITTTVAKTGEPDLIDVKVRWEAVGVTDGPFWVGLDGPFRDIANQYDGAVRIASVVDGSYKTQEKPLEVTTPTPVAGKVDWFGVADRYFIAALIPENPEWGGFQYVPTADGKLGAFLVSDVQQVGPGSPLEATFQLYVGRKDVERLATIGHEMDEAAHLGMWGFFAKILLFILQLYHAAVGNWGVSIILLTCTIRLAIYPLARSGFLSAKRMGALQPKLKEIQELYKDNKEELGRAQMKLFSENGVNPLGGCLPMLGQMPVFFALLAALYVTPDLYHANFLYIQDLSAPDPYGLFPGLMTLGSVLLQRMTPMTGMDETQQQMMKFMPLIFAFFMFSVPAGLSLYYVFNTYLVMLQQWYNMRAWEKIQAASA